MNLQFPLPNRDYKVLIRCNTYNQKKYIKDSLNGFTMQSTDFPYCALIIDDASTDGEQDFLIEYIQNECDTSSAEYMDSDTMLSCVVRHKTNGNCTFVFMLLKENHWQQGKSMVPYYKPWRDHSEYEALCEGDDYWIDPFKIQKQADILDKNIGISLVYTGFKTVNENKADILVPKFISYNKKGFTGFHLAELIKGNFIMFLSTMMRISVLNSPILKNAKVLYDYSYFLAAASIGDLYHIEDITCAYRINAASLMQSQRDSVMKATLKIKTDTSLSVLRNEIDIPNVYNSLITKSVILKIAVSYWRKHKFPEFYMAVYKELGFRVLFTPFAYLLLGINSLIKK